MSAPEPAAPARARSRRRREWRDGGSSVARWDLELTGGAVAALGIGILGARAGAVLLPSEVAALVCPIVLWSAFAVPVAVAFRRSRPRGLLRLQPIDVVIGLVWGSVLRFGQGAFAAAAGEPAWPRLDAGAVTSPGFLGEAIAAVAIAPVLEELFFHGVLLVGVYTVVRRGSGRVAAAIAGIALSTSLFVAAHALVAPQAPADIAALMLVGVAGAGCVLLTGRIWTAVLVHAVYNLLGLAVAVVGAVFV